MKIIKFVSMSPLFAVNRAYQQIVEGVQQELAVEELNLTQAIVLCAMLFEERPLGPSELAHALGLGRSNISHALRYLERQKMINRTLSPDDARRYQLSLTSLGKKKVFRVVKYFDALQVHWENEVGEKKLLSLSQGLDKLVESYGNNR